MSSLICSLLFFLILFKNYSWLSNSFGFFLICWVVDFLWNFFLLHSSCIGCSCRNPLEPFFHQRHFKTLSLQTLIPLNRLNMSNLYMYSTVYIVLIHTYGSSQNLTECAFRIVLKTKDGLKQEWQVEFAMNLLCLTNDPP